MSRLKYTPTYYSFNWLYFMSLFKKLHRANLQDKCSRHVSLSTSDSIAMGGVQFNYMSVKRSGHDRLVSRMTVVHD